MESVFRPPEPLSYPDQDDMVRDRIVIGVLDKTTQERLLRKPELSLQKALNFCRAVESSKTEPKALQNEMNVNELKREKSQNVTAGKFLTYNVCHFCSFRHARGKCPAYGKECAFCKKKNHFAFVCNRKAQNSVQVEQKSLQKWKAKKGT